MTDCLTAIHYVFKQALQIDLPITYISDMPRRLLFDRHLRPVKIKREEAKCGDLLFVKNKERPKLLSHVALFLTPQLLFHCNAEEGTAVIETVDSFFQRFEQFLTFHQAIRYIDSRNVRKREQMKSHFIH